MGELAGEVVKLARRIPPTRRGSGVKILITLAAVHRLDTEALRLQANL
jgi:hypothetical protein